MSKNISKDAPVHQMNSLQRFFLSSKRIFKIATKPTRKEYWTMMKICLIGLAIIGGLSYIIQLIITVIPLFNPS